MVRNTPPFSEAPLTPEQESGEDVSSVWEAESGVTGSGFQITAEGAGSGGGGGSQTLGSPVMYTEVSVPPHVLSTGYYVPFRYTGLCTSPRGGGWHEDYLGSWGLPDSQCSTSGRECGARRSGYLFCIQGLPFPWGTEHTEKDSTLIT